MWWYWSTIPDKLFMPASHVSYVNRTILTKLIQTGSDLISR